MESKNVIVENINTTIENKEKVDWGYHCIKYYTYYYKCILCVINKRYENIDFNKSELAYILEKISNIKIEPMDTNDFYEFLNNEFT